MLTSSLYCDLVFVVGRIQTYFSIVIASNRGVCQPWTHSLRSRPLRWSQGLAVRSRIRYGINCGETRSWLVLCWGLGMFETSTTVAHIHYCQGTPSAAKDYKAEASTYADFSPIYHSKTNNQSDLLDLSPFRDRRPLPCKPVPSSVLSIALFSPSIINPRLGSPHTQAGPAEIAPT